jgi:aspartyl-tRNA(Asn)/glutamyl-tRNA(Gln) amidotransferase subunit C
MEVNDKLIDQLCKLACLEFDEAGKAEIREDLKKMIGFVEKLNEIDTTGIEPLLYMGDEMNILREDMREAPLSRRQALQNAPLADEVFFKVPKVVRNPGEIL